MCTVFSNVSFFLCVNHIQKKCFHLKTIYLQQTYAVIKKTKKWRKRFKAMIKKNTQLKLFCFDLAKEMEQMYLNMNGIQRLFSAAVVFKWNYGTCARLNGVEYFISEFIPEIIFQSIPFHFSCIIVPHPHETCTLKIGFMYTVQTRI